jgi:hypothetical protein
VVCIFIIFSAITLRLLVIRRARQQLNNNNNTLTMSEPRERFQVAEGHILGVLAAGNDSSDYLFLLVRPSTPSIE